MSAATAIAPGNRRRRPVAADGGRGRAADGGAGNGAGDDDGVGSTAGAAGRRASSSSRPLPGQHARRDGRGRRRRRLAPAPPAPAPAPGTVPPAVANTYLYAAVGRSDSLTGTAGAKREVFIGRLLVTPACTAPRPSRGGKLRYKFEKNAGRDVRAKSPRARTRCAVPRAAIRTTGDSEK